MSRSNGDTNGDAVVHRVINPDADSVLDPDADSVLDTDTDTDADTNTHTNTHADTEPRRRLPIAADQGSLLLPVVPGGVESARAEPLHPIQPLPRLL
jgi:hypothetical protein